MTTSTRRFGAPRNPASPSVAVPAAAIRRDVARARERHTARALACAVAVVSLPTALRSEAGPDLWWHVHTGRRILEGRSIPGIDDLSFTAAGEPWANHEWLTQVIFATVHGWGGGVGLVVLRAVLFVATVTGLAVSVHRRVGSPALTLGVLAPAVLFAEPYLNVRAHTFTYLLFVWTIVVLDRVGERNRVAGFVLPLVMVLWVNLHGGFVLGLGLIALTLGTMLVKERADHRRARGLATLGLVCLAATLLNPSGPAMYQYLLSELGANHSLISEWQPATGATLVGLWVVVMAVVVLSVLARRVPSLALVLVTLAAAVATARHARFFVVVALVGAVAAAEVLTQALSRFSSTRGGWSVRRSKSMVVLTVLAAAAGAVFLAGAPGNLRGLEVIDDGAPVAAAEFLAAHDLGGPNLVSHLDWGGFLIWTFDGDYKVAVDGRNLTVYDDVWVDDYLRSLQSGELLDVEGMDQADAWLLRPGSAQVRSLDDDLAWSRVYTDGEAVVFARYSAWDGPPVAGPAQVGQAVYFPDS